MNPSNPLEPMCNPKAQAKYLNDNGAELFVSAGLCVGHDALFVKACDGPVTTAIAEIETYLNNKAHGGMQHG